jgi:hypothetical protein
VTTGEITDGTASVVAASGDQIEMTFNGQAVSPTQLTTDMDIVGGTGRFGDASGELETTAEVLADGSWTSGGFGWMSY